MIGVLSAEKLLAVAASAFVSNVATEGGSKLWQAIASRLRKNQPVEAEIVELEQNPSRENLQQLEPYLHLEMHKDPSFAEEISKLAQEIAEANSGDRINTGDMKAETGGVAAAKIDARGNNNRIGGADTANNYNLGKD